MATPAFNPEQIVSSEDGWMDLAMEAAHSAAIEPNTDFTSYETCVAGPLDLSPATGSIPPASMPIESDWAPIMEFSSADIFQHSPLGDVLNSLRSLSLSGGPWLNCVRLEWEADDEEIRSPPTTHLIATVDDLTDMLDFAPKTSTVWTTMPEKSRPKTRRLPDDGWPPLRMTCTWWIHPKRVTAITRKIQ